MYILYKTTNTVNGRYYVGVTNDNDKYYKGSGTALLNAIKEYGGKHFIRETLETFETEKEAFAREAEVVNEDFVNDRSTYNIKVGGKGGTGQSKSETHKQKIREARAKQANNNGGRKNLTSKAKLCSLIEQYGWEGGAEKLGISLSAFKTRYYRSK